jgi:hypothetical protein
MNAGSRDAYTVPAGDYAAPAQAPQQNLNQFLGANATQGSLGAQAVNRALESGLTAEQIRNQAAAQGLNIGAGALQQLQINPAPQNANSLAAFLGGNSTPGVLGAQAFNRAIQSGLTPQQIQSQAAAQGLTIGANAQQAANAPATVAPKFDKNAGFGQNVLAAGNTLSQKELQRISRVTGKSQDQVLEKAVQKGLSIGSKVVNQYTAENSLLPEAARFVTQKGQEINYDPFSGNPILQKINNSPKLDKGSKLFISSKGSTSTVLPRGPVTGTQPNRNTRPVSNEPAMPTGSPTGTAAPNMTPAGQGQMNVQDFLDQLMTSMEEPAMAAMPTLESFEDVSSEFDINDPLQFAALGQSYLTDAIRAARRRAQTRRDYMRNMMMMSMMQGMSPLSIGGGLNVG